MKYCIIAVLTIAFNLSPLFSFSQSKEDFLNAVYLHVVDSSYPYYYIAERCSKFHILSYEKKQVISDLTDYVHDSVAEQMLSGALSDTIKEKWNCALLPNARCLDKHGIDSIIPNGYFVNFKAKWSKKKRKREEKKQLNRQEAERVKKPGCEHFVFYFSKPVFSIDEKFALITMDSYCGMTCGGRCLYLFKKENGWWVLLTRTSCYVS